MSFPKQEALIKKIEKHLRVTARQLIKVNTEEEALKYLTDSFRLELYCDFVGVILKEGDFYRPKAWSGQLPSIENEFPLLEKECSSKLMNLSLTDETADSAKDCRLAKVLQNANVKTWFTVPLTADQHRYGFCVLGFLNYIPLLDMEKNFEEFGQDIALAITIMRQKEEQLKKVEGMEWISKHFSLDTPLEEQIYELTSRAASGTNADFACIYFYNDSENCLELQEPYYGEMEVDRKKVINDNYLLKNHFPYLETPSGHQLTVPIVIDVKLIGVLHIETKKSDVFTDEDLKMLQLLTKHFSTLVENAQLYNSEKNNKKRLEYLLNYQQELVKETIEDNNFDGITSMLSHLFENSIILFDRFLRPLSFHLWGMEKDESFIAALAERAREEIVDSRRHSSIVFGNKQEPMNRFTFWPVTGGGSLLGYLTVSMPGDNLDEFEQLTIELSRNICSIQFIKQKLAIDAREQAKDSLLGKLLIEKIHDQDSIIQYANLFQWDLFRSHRVSVISIQLHDSEMKTSKLLEHQANRSEIWDYIKSLLLDLNSNIITASHDDKFILIVPVWSKTEKPRHFWKNIYEKIQSSALVNSRCRVLMGIGGRTKEIQDYFTSYQEALQALNVVNSRYGDVGFSMFEELGTYTILSHLEQTPAVYLFVKRYLEPLIKYSEEKNIDLCHTLYVFLQSNGNVKYSAEELYIHRSSLIYRLEKVEALLEEDLNNAETRFNIMMAFKLYDLYGDAHYQKRLPFLSKKVNS